MITEIKIKEKKRNGKPVHIISSNDKIALESYVHCYYSRRAKQKWMILKPLVKRWKKYTITLTTK